MMPLCRRTEAVRGKQALWVVADEDAAEVFAARCCDGEYKGNADLGGDGVADALGLGK